MARHYSGTPAELKPGKLDRETLASIGQLVRAFAEIEDLITLFICNLAEISESKAVVLLGRTIISRKLEIALYLAKMTNAGITQVHKNLFGAKFSELLECRNAVAHGVFMGVWEEDGETYFAFLTAKTEDPTGPSARQLVISFTAARIAEVAQITEQSIPKIERLLKLGTLREKRLGQALSPHRKGQPQPKQPKKHQRQPQS